MFVDLALGTLAMALAYQLRFGADEALHFMTAAAPVLFLHPSAAIRVDTILKLYRLDGQTMWPVRLGVGAIAGAALALSAASWLGIDEGVSRQAVAIQPALLCLCRRIVARRGWPEVPPVPGGENPRAVRRAGTGGAGRRRGLHGGIPGPHAGLPSPAVEHCRQGSEAQVSALGPRASPGRC